MTTPQQKTPDFLKTGTYYVQSGTYISPEGYGMSISPEYAKEFIEDKRPKISFGKDPYLKDIQQPKLDTSQITEIKGLELPDIPKFEESYDPRSGTYISTRPEHLIGTSISTRQPTISEQKKIREAEIKGGLFAGLEGRKRRRQVSEAKEGLKKDIEQIDLFRKGIKQREEKLDSWEKDIEKKEKELEEYKKDKAYRELAWKIASDQVSGGLMGRLPKKYQEMARKWSDELEQSKATHIKAYQKSFEPKQPETSKIELEIQKPKEYTLKIPSFDLNLNNFNRNLERTEIVKLKPIELSSFTSQQYIGTIEAVPEPKGLLEKGQSFLSRKRAEYGTKKGRGEDIGVGDFLLGGVVAGAGSSLIGSLKWVKSLITEPVKTTKQTITGLYGIGERVVSGKGFPEIGRTLRQEPAFSLGFAGMEALTMKGGGILLKKGSGSISKLSTRLSPKYRGVSSIGDTKTIKNVPTSKGRTIDISISKKIPMMSLSAQTKLAGKTKDLVSGARDLFGGLKKEIPIRKPIKNEELLSETTRNMLKKFDEGTLPKHKISELNKRIQQETGAKGLLERSFFADPGGQLRPSRLGIRKERGASFLDYVVGDVTFRRARPQAILFPEQNIAKFPKTLEDVRKALSKGKELTESQKRRLLEWQLEQKGEWKPIGFLTKESEITATGGIIKKVKTDAVTLINGHKVPIIEARIIKPTKETARLLNKYRKGDISSNEINKLNKALKKETGIDYSSVLYSKKYVYPSSVIGSGAGIFKSFKNYGVSKSKKSSSSIIFFNSTSSNSKPTSSGINFFSVGSAPSPTLTTTSKISSSTTSTTAGGSGILKYKNIPPKTPNVPIRKEGQLKEKSILLTNQSSQKGFDVGVIKKGKPKIIKRGLNLPDARDYGAEKALKTLRATFFIKSSKKRAKDIPDTNIFYKNRNLFRKPVKGSDIYQKLKDASEIYVQKKRKVRGVGSRLGTKPEVEEIHFFKKQKGGLF